MERQETQSYLAFVEEATKALQNDEISYTEWCKAIVGEKIYSDETLRRCAVLFGEFLEQLDKDEIKTLNDENRVNRLTELKEEIIKEKKKLSDVNREAQEYYRSRSRTELLAEQIKEAVAQLKPVKVIKITHIKPTERVGLLTIADAHYDSNFSLNGLFGETVNEYSKETFCTRMWNLLAKIDADEYKFDKLKIVSMGDCLENLLRVTSLTKLRQPVVKSAIEYAEFLTEWMLALQERLQVPVDFALVPGNHGRLRFLSQRGDSFPDENIEYIVYEFIKLRLQDCPNINVEPYGDVYFTTVFNENLVFAHGETKDLQELMEYFENLYNVSIDACYGAHYHSESSKAVGVGNVGSKRIIRVPSMCGTDTFAKTLLKHNRAGAYFALFSEDGEEMNKIYYLN